MCTKVIAGYAKCLHMYGRSFAVEIVIFVP